MQCDASVLRRPGRSGADCLADVAASEPDGYEKSTPRAPQVTLCAGCTFAGTGSDPLFFVTHKDGLTLDRASVSVGDLQCRDKTIAVQAVEARRRPLHLRTRGRGGGCWICGGRAGALGRGDHGRGGISAAAAAPQPSCCPPPGVRGYPPQVSDPDVALTSVEAREHPACSGWLKGAPAAAAAASGAPPKPPVCPSADQLSALKATFKTRLIVSPDALPPAALGDSQAVTALMQSSAAWPSEARRLPASRARLAHSSAACSSPRPSASATADGSARPRRLRGWHGEKTIAAEAALTAYHLLFSPRHSCNSTSA